MERLLICLRKYLKKEILYILKERFLLENGKDKEGNTRYSTDIIADKMTMLGTKQENTPSSSSDQVRETLHIDSSVNQVMMIYHFNE